MTQIGEADVALERAKNVILVHGVAVDGSTWRLVYDALAGKGINVVVVQMPMDGFDSDVAAARRILDSVEGPTVLVGHSYGGAVITQIGTDARVAALVYVAALQPDVGESLASLSERFPPAAPLNMKTYGTDRFTPDPATFHADLAADLPEPTAAFLAASLKPTATTAATATVTQIAWKQKLSYGIVSTEDRTISPELQRFMYGRADAGITEIAASHMVILSHPDQVASVILEAVDAIQ